jgi:hypothetical protein
MRTPASRATATRCLFGILATLALITATLAAQASKNVATSPARAATTSAAPRTPWGQPDLQGIWDFRTVTPLERPADLAGKETLTEQEAAEYEKRIAVTRNADANRGKSVRRTVSGTAETEDVALAYNDFWWDRGTRVIRTRRTSLVTDPPDGRIPALTPEAKKRLSADDALRERPAEGPEDRGVAERCLLGFNAGPPMTPGGYNQNIQIVQTRDHVMIMNEMVHSARVVPLDGRSHGTVRQWMGDSRGRWQGDTLVVDTINFYQTTSLRGSSPSLHVIERFTRVDPDTLVYEFTVDDPTTWTRPWTAQIPMTRTDDPIYEYACHEANYGMEGLLKGARAIEKEASPAR